MQTKSVQSDKGIGFAVLFSVVTVIAAAGMVVSGDQLTTAVAFAVAVVAASLAVVAAQAFW
ncbi:DUF7525 family protein [Halogeometricum limi]|uniref:Uncharacterized protein n=1 Tax=Halogeometricum limi TaxID=555875 RepID=A0A1I6GPL4_9EURY|nr:hypothetical protein [Halogeometricum limi]SFR44163.1 hypothetical protein SAMN04488124_1366 [Halogeometricum limi]